jgi:hypothetical protein
VLQRLRRRRRRVVLHPLSRGTVRQLHRVGVRRVHCGVGLQRRLQLVRSMRRRHLRGDAASDALPRRCVRGTALSSSSPLRFRTNRRRGVVKTLTVCVCACARVYALLQVNRTSCVRCPAGSASDATAFVGPCTPCASGTFSSDSGRSQCTPCGFLQVRWPFAVGLSCACACYLGFVVCRDDSCGGVDVA